MRFECRFRHDGVNLFLMVRVRDGCILRFAGGGRTARAAGEQQSVPWGGGELPTSILLRKHDARPPLLPGEPPATSHCAGRNLRAAMIAGNREIFRPYII